MRWSYCFPGAVASYSRENEVFPRVNTLVVGTFALMSFPEKKNMDISAIKHKFSRFLGILTKLKYKRNIVFLNIAEFLLGKTRM